MFRHALVVAMAVLAGCTEAGGDVVERKRSALDDAPLTFDGWKARYLAADQLGRAELEPAGERLALARQADFLALMASDPEQALATAVTPPERLALPASVTRHLETWRDGVGTLHVVAGVGDDAPLERFVTLDDDDEVLRAAVFGARLGQGTRSNVRLHGVALDGVMAVSDRRLRKLFPGEVVTLPREFPRACPVSKKRAEAALEFHGGDAVYGFCVPMHAEEFDGTLAQGEETAAAGEGFPPASTWSEGAKSVLYVRVDFSDRVGDPLSAASAESVIETPVSNYFNANSFGRASMTATVTPTLRLPRTRASYQDGGAYLQLRQDALVVARDAGFDPSLFDRDVIAFASTFSGWAGRGYVGSKGTWLNGNFSFSVTAHELGHNYGMQHANFWNANGLTIIGPGSNVEYGNPFDVMGTGGGQSNHHNAWFKRRLDWLTASEVATVTTSTTVRLHALELPISSGLHAAKVRRDSRKDYWLEYRPAINTPHALDGISINWGYLSNDPSHLLDMTPGDGTRGNSMLIIGRTFSDRNAGIHLTPVGKGGTTPESVDVVVNLGTFPGNRAPMVTLTASTLTPAIGAPVTFTATASDPDGDTLAYAWDYDDGTWAPNLPTATKSFSAARTHSVRLTVSDMKGGTASTSVLITVGTPTTFTLSGTVREAGVPLEGVRISDGTRATFTSGDGTYALTNVPAGTSTVTASKVDYTFTRGFTSPVTVSADTSGLDFTATKVAGYQLRGRVAFGTTGIAGVTVTDGSRTATTNSNGDYTISSVPSGRYTVTASKPGWQFSASGWSNPVDVLGGDVTALNFYPQGNTLYGTIPTAGVSTAPVITDGVRTATATMNGSTWSYYLSAVPNGTWNLVATSPGVTLVPSSFTNPVTVQGMSLGNLHFALAAAGTYSVQGTVRTGGTPLPGVVVSDGTRSATTDALGSYTLVGVPPGTYTLTPTLSGYAFVPATLSVTVSTANLTGRDFTTTVVNAAPTVAMAAAANPSPVTSGVSTVLSVLGADDGGEGALRYTWNTNGGGYPVSFSASGTNAAKNATATFSGPGTYTIECIITDAGGLSVRSSVTVQVQPVPTSFAITPATATVQTGATQLFRAEERDQFGRVMFSGTPMWSVSGGGSVTPSGSTSTFTAGATPGGPFVVTASVGGRMATALVTVAASGSPMLVAAAAATPNPVTGTSTALSVRASDDLGEPALTYTWSTTLAPSPVTFSANASNTAKDTTATFTEAGDYAFTVEVRDGDGNTVSSSVLVTVQATPTTLDVQPRLAQLQPGQQQAFVANVTDQFDLPLAPQPTVAWTIAAGGTVDGSGLFTAGPTAGGPFALTATADTLTASAQITIVATPDTTAPTVSLRLPMSGARLQGPAALAAEAMDDVGVVRVEFFADGATSLGTVSTTPWELTFDASSLGDGAHVLTARAFDAAGNVGTSSPVDIVVGAAPDLAPPTVHIVSPLAGAETDPSVTVSVEAADDVGVSQVSLEVDGAAPESLGAAPWVRALTLTAGAHTLVAIASDAAGNVARSQPVTFTVRGEPPMETEPPPPPEPVVGGCAGCATGADAPLALLGLWLAFCYHPRRRKNSHGEVADRTRR